MAKVSVLALCHCDKMPKVNNLEEGKVHFGCGFRGVSPWPCVHLAARPVVRHYNVTGVHGRENLLTSRLLGRK